MDIATEALVKDFLNNQEIKSRGQAKDFELFCNYAIVGSEYNKELDVFSVSTGGGDDAGIDGLAIVVNGQLIEEEAEVDDLISVNSYLDVSYTFVQAKSCASIDTSKLQSFYFGIKEFFSNDSGFITGGDLLKAKAISNYIFSKSPKFKSNPTLKIYYAVGRHVNYENDIEGDKNIASIMKRLKQQLEDTGLFEKIELRIVGSQDVGNLYRKMQSPIEATFNFINKIALPDIRSVDEAYFGVIPVSEFKKIIVDENDNLKSIFDDNVRDFQGDKNYVNAGIQSTLGGDNPELFSVLNNGVTIVADSIRPSGYKFTISDYQIVNGCQTANVLYVNRHNLNLDHVNVPIRLIATRNNDVKSEVVISTNRQTAIKKEQLAAMSEFQKNLQIYYSSVVGEGRLYYERRDREYSCSGDVGKKKIISIAIQLKSFSSMVNKDPHNVTTYFGKLAAKIGEKGSKLFESGHAFSTYYMAGLAYYRLDGLFSLGVIDKKYRKIKFYLLMIFPMIVSDKVMPPLNSVAKCDEYCRPLIDCLNNEVECREVFAKAIEVVDRSSVNVEDKEALKSKEMTNRILDFLDSNLEEFRCVKRVLRKPLPLF